MTRNKYYIESFDRLYFKKKEIRWEKQKIVKDGVRECEVDATSWSCSRDREIFDRGCCRSPP